MAFKIKFKSSFVLLEEFLLQDIPADVKEGVWNDNDVTSQLFRNTEFMLKRQAKILPVRIYQLPKIVLKCFDISQSKFGSLLLLFFLHTF